MDPDEFEKLKNSILAALDSQMVGFAQEEIRRQAHPLAYGLHRCQLRNRLNAVVQQVDQGALVALREEGQTLDFTVIHVRLGLGGV